MKDTFKNTARFVIRPNKNGGDDKLILGCSFNSGVLKPGFVYEIVEILGQIVIREVGESSCKYSHQHTKGMACWCNDANHIIYSGTHLLTDKEYNEHIHESRSEEEKINDHRKEVLDDIFSPKPNFL